MSDSSRKTEALGAIASLLVEHEAKVGLNEIRDILEALDSRAYADGFRDGQENADAAANEVSEREDDLHFGSHDPSDGCGA
jgi:hypothetical protein